ncbi:MAG: hypothetical protein KDA80_00020 [Planctomycetaceae bacterium]|nr:hypothetical protein [Planctomycetaceae bacterium]
MAIDPEALEEALWKRITDDLGIEMDEGELQAIVIDGNDPAPQPQSPQSHRSPPRKRPQSQPPPIKTRHCE